MFLLARYKFLLLSDWVKSQMCGKNCMKSDVSTSTPFGLYINKREGGGVCELLGRRGGSHGNIVLGPRVLNGDGLRNKPKKKYISVQVCRVCVFGCVVMCLLCVACVCVCVHACVSVCVRVSRPPSDRCSFSYIFHTLSPHNTSSRGNWKPTELVSSCS